MHPPPFSRFPDNPDAFDDYLDAGLGDPYLHWVWEGMWEPPQPPSEPSSEAGAKARKTPSASETGQAVAEEEVAEQTSGRVNPPERTSDPTEKGLPPKPPSKSLSINAQKPTLSLLTNQPKGD